MRRVARSARTLGMALLFALAGARAGAQDTLPFRRAVPHPELRALLAIEGTYTVRSVLVDGNGKKVNERRFRAVAAHKVYGLVLAIDTFLEGAEQSMQTSMIVRRDTALVDITVSANGFVEFWDRVDPREGEVAAFRLRGAARLMTEGPDGRPLRFRKAFRRATPRECEVVFEVSEDDGKTWRPRFEEFATRVDPSPLYN